MTLASEGSGDVIVRVTVAGEIKHSITHFFSSRELGDGIHLHLDVEIAHSAATPDDSNQRNIVLATVEHDFVDEAAQ